MWQPEVIRNMSEFFTSQQLDIIMHIHRTTKIAENL